MATLARLRKVKFREAKPEARREGADESRSRDAGRPKTVLQQTFEKGLPEKKVVKESKKRRYSVKLHVIEARGAWPLEDGSLPDLVVAATVSGEATKYTRAVHNTVACQFDSFLEWDVDSSLEAFQRLKLTLQLLNAKTMESKDPLGMYTLKLKDIRAQPLSEHFMTWLALYQSDSKFTSEFSGAIRVTVSCLAGKQAVAKHSLTEIADAEGDENPFVLMPPLVRYRCISLFIAIYRIDGLEAYGALGEPASTFASVKMAGSAASKTRVVRETHNPVYNQMLRLPARLPTFLDKITISINKYEESAPDMLIADMCVSLSELVKRREIAPHWVNLYGVEGEHDLRVVREQLKRGVDTFESTLETSYKGRLLMAARVEEVPALLSAKAKSIARVNDPLTELYVLRFDAYQALQLCQTSVTDETQLQLQVQVGKMVLRTATLRAVQGVVVWHEVLPEQSFRLPTALEQCPDVFISIYFEDHTTCKQMRLGFIRLQLSDAYGFNHAPMWGTLERDPLHSKISAVPGFVEYRLDIGRADELPQSSRELISLPAMRRYELRAHIYQARGFPAMDDDGLCNPYVVVTLAGYAGVTREAAPTCNPIFYESLRVDCMLPHPVPVTAQILVRVYDKEPPGTEGGDQLVGSAAVPVLNVDKLAPAEPTWLELTDGAIKGVVSEILGSFQLVPYSDLEKVPFNDMTPPMRDCEVEVSIVGLRGMLTFANQPIQAPYVEFDCGDRSSGRVRRTQPSSPPSGPDANFLETLTIRMRLPDALLYCPSIHLRVFDKREGDDPCVGSLSIPLAPYCDWLYQVPYRPRRPRIPEGTFGDDGSESSAGEEDLQDNLFGRANAPTIPADLYEANFSYSNEIVFETMSMVERYREQSRGRLKKGHRKRTVPYTDAITPHGLQPLEVNVEELHAKPEEAELEFSIEDPPFEEWPVIRETSDGSSRREVGRFKARIRVIETAHKASAHPPLDLKYLFEQGVYVTRLYVTRGTKLARRQNGTRPDPYLVLRNGSQKQNIIDDIENARRCTANPTFFKCFELPTMIPGNPVVHVAV